MADSTSELINGATHAPKNRHEYRAAAIELASRGLKPRDISECLSLTECGVRELLGERLPIAKAKR
jgi:hypothetical protein